MEAEDYILVAENDEDDQFLFKLAMNDVSPDQQLLFVKNGADLIMQLEIRKPRIIILDINMPGKSGLVYLKEIRNNPAYDSIPVLMYSTSDDYRQMYESYVSGANLYLLKPSDFEKIKDIVRSIFELDIKKILKHQPFRQYVVH